MSTIEVIALRPFIYSLDGYTEIPVNEHETFDLPEKFFQGLNDARYVRRAKIGDGKVSLKANETSDERLEEIASMTPHAQAKRFVESFKEEVSKQEPEVVAAVTDVEIPDDWRSLKFFALRSLASKLSSDPVKNSEDAIAAIEAELARRG